MRPENGQNQSKSAVETVFLCACGSSSSAWLRLPHISLFPVNSTTAQTGLSAACRLGEAGEIEVKHQ